MKANEIMVEEQVSELLGPMIKVTKKELKAACRPWKKTTNMYFHNLITIMNSISGEFYFWSQLRIILVMK